MKIDWNKWIIEHLPFSLRTVRVFTFITVLISPICKLYREFVAWSAKMRIKSGGSPQVCMLKRIIKDELGLDVLIEEGNGKPIDFIIKTSFDNVDIERQLFALLDRYKLAGKSYGYENAEILFENIWSKFVCEKGLFIVNFSKYVCEKIELNARFSKYVCERAGKRLNVIATYLTDSNNSVRIISSYPVNIPLMIYYSIRDDETTHSIVYTGIEMKYNLSYGLMFMPNSFFIDIIEDNEYEYQIKNILQ